MKRVSSEDAEGIIAQDVAALSKLFEQTVYGFAYPYGVHTKASEQILKDNGIMYGRTSRMSKDFSMPKDLLHLPVNGWHTQKDVLQKLQCFVQAEAEEDLLFLMFAHGYTVWRMWT